jgi:hypothetical protein
LQEVSNTADRRSIEISKLLPDSVGAFVTSFRP